ncbi:hypothetical protein F2Q69_00036057 [Brassica cretica]|uniref:Uncharacterized protein n=1 Tax=Brassica cretica TaxID=69181 RepID=A0A8S9SS03_BRACR|nr:hypothetical protein F2Q69_00036057 [Brassica cretica]
MKVNQEESQAKNKNHGGVFTRKTSRCRLLTPAARAFLDGAVRLLPQPRAPLKATAAYHRDFLASADGGVPSHLLFGTGGRKSYPVLTRGFRLKGNRPRGG